MSADGNQILRRASASPISAGGAAARLAAEQGLHTWSLSLSHSQTHAIAVVTAAG
jgi:holo-[acyl-carrier protein] synthase